MDRPIPDGFTAVTPYLMVPDVDREVAFLRDAFDAEVVRTSAGPTGVVTHGEVRVGGAAVMMGRANDAYPPVPAMLYVYVGDADVTFARATAAGAAVAMPLGDQFYGDRCGSVVSPGGITYCVAHKL